MPQLWQGRASKAVDSRVNDFNSSIRFDARMIEQDIQGSLVHSATPRKGDAYPNRMWTIFTKVCTLFWRICTAARWRSTPTPRTSTPSSKRTLTARLGDAG